MPVDRGAIDAQLREIGEGERWWEQREFRDLPHILHSDELIQGVIRGKLLGSRGSRVLTGAPWLIVATNQRLICLKQERFGRKQVEIAAGQIMDIRQTSRLRGYQIIIHTPQRKFRIRIAKEDAFRFVGALAPLLPAQQTRPLHPDLSALSWLPGITTVASMPGLSGIVSKVAMLSPPDYATRDQVARLELTVERLLIDVEHLQQQVEFLEKLLQTRAENPLQPALSQGSASTATLTETQDG
jgi:hypothetical protein